MAETVTRLYEVLFRMSGGKYNGAHQIWQEGFEIDGEFHPVRELPAQPIDAKGDAAKLIGAETAKVIEAAQSARAETEAVKQRLTEQIERAEKAERDFAHNEGLLKEARAEIGSLKKN